MILDEWFNGNFCLLTLNSPNITVIWLALLLQIQEVLEPSCLTTVILCIFLQSLQKKSEVVL
jgi:hypothetical protein